MHLWTFAHGRRIESKGSATHSTSQKGGSSYIHSHIVSRELPGVEIKPVVWNLDLVPINDFLLEDAVPVSQTVAPSRLVQGRKTVEEAGSETTKTAISERRIMFLL